MNATGKLILFLLSLFLLFGGIGLQTALSTSQTLQVSEPEAQVTVPPLPTLPIATQPPEPGGGGGGGSLNTMVIGLLLAVALVAFVGLLLWMAARGRSSSTG